MNGSRTARCSASILARSATCTRFMMGTTLPFAPTEGERAERGDPRPSIAARYRDRDDYLAQARAAAQELADAGHIVVADIDLAVQLAAQRYDILARSML